MMKEKTVLDTADIYQGYYSKEDYWIVADYDSLVKNPDIDQDTICYSQSGIEQEAFYFQTFIEEAVQNFEKKHRRKIRRLAFSGSVGTWRGRIPGGKFMLPDKNPLLEMGDVDNVSVALDDEGRITFYGRHHDGTHRMTLYAVTAKEYSELLKTYTEEDPDIFKEVAKSCMPLLSDYAEGYFEKPDVELSDAGNFW